MNHAVATLDETGSMRGQEERVVSALNQYVNALPKGTNLTVFKFDSKRWVTQFAGIAKDWKPLTLKDYRPGAWTPLYDAIAWTIHHAESLASDGDKVVVVIDTDGRENSGDYILDYPIMNIILRLNDKQLMESLTVLASDVPLELVDAAANLLESPDKLFRVEYDTALAGELTVTLHPSDGLLGLVAAAGTGQG